MKHKKQHLFGIFLNALALVRCVHSVSSKIHFLNTQHYSIANNERLLVYGFKVGIKRITLRGMKRRVRKMTFIVSIFYQPQGWSTCAAAPGAGPGSGDI